MSRPQDAQSESRRAEAAEARICALEEALGHLPGCGNCMSGRFHQCPIYTAALADKEGDA